MLGDKIKELRQYFDLNQSQLGRILGVKKQAVSMIESNNRGLNYDQIRKIVKTYKIDVRWLFEQGIDKIEDADLSKRGEDANLTQTEALLREIQELKQQRKPVEDLDPIAHRVMISQPHYELMKEIQFWDANMVRQFKAMAFAYLAGKEYGEHTIQKETSDLKHSNKAKKETRGRSAKETSVQV